MLLYNLKKKKKKKKKCFLDLAFTGNYLICNCFDFFALLFTRLDDIKFLILHFRRIFLRPNKKDYRIGYWKKLV